MNKDFMRCLLAEAHKQREIRRAKTGLEVPVLDKEWAEWLAKQGKTAETIGAYRSSLLNIDDDPFYIELEKIDKRPEYHEDFFEDVTNLVESAKDHTLTSRELLTLADLMLKPWMQRFKESAKDENLWTPKEIRAGLDALKSYCAFIGEYVLTMAVQTDEEK